MSPLFILGDILQTTQGVVLAGSLNSPLPNNPSSVGFWNGGDRFVCWTVRETYFTVSISNKIDLFLLLGSIQLPSILKPGAIIYFDREAPAEGRSPRY